MEKIILSAFADEASPFLSGQIAAMTRNGITGLELRNVDGLNVSELSPEKAREIRKILSDSGLFVWSAGSPLGKIDIDDDFSRHLDVFKHTVDVTRELGAEHIRLFSFFLPKGEDPENYKNAVMDRLGAFVEAAEGSGVILCHENEKGIYGDMASRCVKIHETFPSLKCIFDPANYIQCGQETLSAWEMLKGYVEYLHIKDALPDGNVVPAGKGAGHVPEIVTDYIARGGRHFTLEPHLTVFDGLAALERKGDESGVGSYSYPSADAAFDAAVAALKALLPL